jgi:hypothetical protein
MPVIPVIEKRCLEFKLELHPEKTKIFYCEDDKRRRGYPNEKFDFFGLYVPNSQKKSLVTGNRKTGFLLEEDLKVILMV